MPYHAQDATKDGIALAKDVWLVHVFKEKQQKMQKLEMRDSGRKKRKVLRCAFLTLLIWVPRF